MGIIYLTIAFIYGYLCIEVASIPGLEINFINIILILVLEICTFYLIGFSTLYIINGILKINKSCSQDLSHSKEKNQILLK